MHINAGPDNNGLIKCCYFSIAVLVDTIKQQLENSMGKDEFQRKLNRQRSQMSESGSQGGDGTRSLSRQLILNSND